MYGWASLFGASAPSVPNELLSSEEKARLEKKRPHTYKCICDVTWVAEGLSPMTCWACGLENVIPECLH